MFTFLMIYLITATVLTIVSALVLYHTNKTEPYPVNGVIAAAIGVLAPVTVLLLILTGVGVLTLMILERDLW